MHPFKINQLVYQVVNIPAGRVVRPVYIRAWMVKGSTVLALVDGGMEVPMEELFQDEVAAVEKAKSLIVAVRA